MSKEVITFGNTEIEKQKFHYHKNLILLEDSELITYRYLVWFLLVKKIYKYFIGCKDDDDHKIKLLCIMLSKASPNKEL